MKVAADRAHDQTKTVLPAEVARGVYMRHAPGLQALKLMHLMIATAGGRMADEVQHQMRLSDIRKINGMKNHDRSSLTPLFEELRAAVLTHDDSERKRVSVGGLLDDADINYRDEASGDLLVTWWFARMFRRLAAESNHWAILDRQTIFHLGSKYSVLLFQHIASLSNLDHVQSKDFTIAELRSALGIEDGKLARFSNLNTWALKPAIAEINQLSRLHLTATPNKAGRTVASVTISWQVKEGLSATKRELTYSKSGRKARREGTVEAITDLASPIPARMAFPAQGSIKHGSARRMWLELAEKHAARLHGGHLPDLAVLSDQFRAFCAQKGISLDAKSIEKTFVGFCQKYRPPNA